MVQLQVRRLFYKGAKPFSSEKAARIARGVLETLESLQLHSIDSFRGALVDGMAYTLKENGSASIDADLILEDFCKRAKPYIFFTPHGFDIIATYRGRRDSVEGYGAEGVAVVCTDDLFDYDSPLVNPMHEIGHAHFGLPNHRKSNGCFMYEHYAGRRMKLCHPCLGNARKVDRIYT